MEFPTLQNDLFLKALRGETVERPPVWMMRQAGRFLPDYRALREKYTFFERCETPELVSEITTMPIHQVGTGCCHFVFGHPGSATGIRL